MNYNQIIAYISQWIIDNQNKEITAAIMRDVLDKIVQFVEGRTGDTDNLEEGDDLTEAVNILFGQVSSNNNNFPIEVHTGRDDPNVVPPSSFNAPDFYIQNGNTVWIYNGTSWVKIIDSTSPPIPNLQQVLAMGNIANKPIVGNSFFENKSDLDFAQIKDIQEIIPQGGKIVIGNYIDETHFEDTNGNLVTPSIGSLYVDGTDWYTFDGTKLITAFDEGNVKSVAFNSDSEVLPDANGKVVLDLDSKIVPIKEDISDLEDEINNIEIPEIVDALNSTFADKALSANQGRVIKGFIDDINTLLNSDDTTLDELQEIVNYIKINKNDLENLSVPNIAGLEDALAGKEPKNVPPAADEKVKVYNADGSVAYEDYGGGAASLLSKPFTYTGGLQEFTADFDIVQVDSLLVENTPLLRTQYTVSGAAVTILDPLIIGAVIELNYWKANAVNATNYTKAEADAANQDTFRQIQQTVESIGAGEGGKLYDTEADAKAVTPKPQDGTVFQVKDSGYYTFQSGRTGGIRFDREYEDLEAFKDIFQESKNLFNHNNIIEDRFLISSSGDLSYKDPGWGASGYIPVVAGQEYTLSGNRSRLGLSFFSGRVSESIANSYVHNSDPLTVTAPAGANYVIFNLYSATDPDYSNIQFEKGSVATSYVPFEQSFKIKESALPPFNIETTAIISENDTRAIESKGVFGFKQKFDSITEIVSDGKNLFNPTNIVVGKFINSSVNTEFGAATGWGLSGHIPVVAGQTYTLSGTKGRRGLVFTSTNVIDNGWMVGSYNDSASLPLTVTAPAGANYVIFNLYSATDPNYSEVQFEEGSIATSYMPYTEGGSLGIRASALPPLPAPTPPEDPQQDFYVKLDSTTSENYVSTSINGKKLKQDIRPFKTNYAFGINSTFYDGDEIKSGGDENAPYRIDGGTIGANHNPVAHIRNKEFQLYIDSDEITDFNKKYYPKKDFTVKENYDIEGQNTSGIIAKVSITYVFNSSGNCTIYTDFLATKTIALNDIMFVMAGKMLGNYDMYVPKSLPFSQDSISYDFSSPYNMGGFNPVNAMDFTPTRCEPTGILSDRAIMLKPDVGFALGYLPVQDAGIVRRREVATEKALEIRNNTGKVYMSAIDPEGGDTLTPGDYYSVIAYRNYFAPKANSTASYVVESNGGVYVYLDWHTTTIDRIKLPNELSGKPYEVIEKSDSVSILSKENTGSLVFDVTTEGYAILKI